MRNNLLSLVCLLLLICSCGGYNGGRNKDGQELSVDDAHLDRVLSIDSFIVPGSFHVVALSPANNDSEHISALEFKLATVDGLVFYDNSHNSLEIFNYDGMFKKELKLKQLLGSSIYISDIRKNTYSGRMDILDTKDNLYSLSLAADSPVVVKQYADYHPSLFLPVSQERYIFYNNFKENKSTLGPNRLYMLDNGNGIKAWWPIDTSIVTSVPVFNRQFSQAGDKKRFFDPVYPVIYNVADTGLVPLFRMKYRQYNLKTKNVSDIASILKETRYMGIPSMNYFIESDRYCLFEFGVNKHPLSCICDKSTGQSVGVASEGFGIGKIGMILYNPVYEGDSGELFTILSGRDIQHLLKKEKYEELKGLDSLNSYAKVLVSFRLK